MIAIHGAYYYGFKSGVQYIANMHCVAITLPSLHMLNITMPHGTILKAEYNGHLILDQYLKAVLKSYLAQSLVVLLWLYSQNTHVVFGIEKISRINKIVP